MSDLTAAAGAGAEDGVFPARSRVSRAGFLVAESFAGELWLGRELLALLTFEGLSEVSEVSLGPEALGVDAVGEPESGLDKLSEPGLRDLLSPALRASDLPLVLPESDFPPDLPAFDLLELPEPELRE